jgi:hypothetical protein
VPLGTASAVATQLHSPPLVLYHPVTRCLSFGTAVQLMVGRQPSSEGVEARPRRDSIAASRATAAAAAAAAAVGAEAGREGTPLGGLERAMQRSMELNLSEFTLRAADAIYASLHAQVDCHPSRGGEQLMVGEGSGSRVGSRQGEVGRLLCVCYDVPCAPLRAPRVSKDSSCANAAVNCGPQLPAAAKSDGMSNRLRGGGGGSSITEHGSFAEHRRANRVSLRLRWLDHGPLLAAGGPTAMEKVANREMRVWHFVIENGY